MANAPLVLLHGFAGHADSWRSLIDALPEPARANVHAITAFGHEPREPARQPIAFGDEVERLVGHVRRLGEPVHLVGYSMGGRLALGIVERAPELVRGAIVIGANPGLASESERRERREGDERWARLLEEEGMAAFVERWQAQPIFATQAHAPADALERQRTIRMRHDPRSLAHAMRSLGLAEMPSYWGVVAEARAPITIVVGARDTKYVALATKMESIARGAAVRRVEVEGSGHNVVLEAPERLLAIVRQCLAPGAA